MNKTFFKSFFFMGLVACMFSCKDDDSPLDGGNTPQGVNVRFDYSQAKLGRSQGSSATLNGSSDADWTIEVEDDDFFSVEPMSGTAGVWGIERSGFFNDRGKWAKGFENQRV